VFAKALSLVRALGEEVFPAGFAGPPVVVQTQQHPVRPKGPGWRQARISKKTCVNLLNSLLTPTRPEPMLALVGDTKPDAINSIRPIMTNFLSRWTDLLVSRGLRLAAVILLAIIFIRLMKSFTRRLVKKAGAEAGTRTGRMREQQTETVAHILESFGVFVILGLTALMALREFGYDVAPLAAAAGLASLALGFGAQNLVRDIINGFFIVFEDQFVVGDTIRIGEVIGRVEHITLRRTVMRDPQGAIVTIPNGTIQQVANLSRDWSQIFLGVTIAPDAPVEAPLAALDRVAAEFRADTNWAGALVDGPRVLGVDAFGPMGAKLVVQVRTAPNRQDDVARELRRRISARFEQEGIQTTGLQRVVVQYAAKEEKETNDGPNES
jgi:small-conductance mechanosensitive channel